MEKIEQLRKEVDSIKESLNTLKNNIDIPVNERKNQAKTLKDKAEETKQKIEVEINNLDGQTKTEAQTLLNKSMNEITELYTSIVNTPASPTTTPAQSLTEDKKNIFTKAKDWIWNQRNNIWDSWKWTRDSEWWKNLLRVAWFGITIVWWAALLWALAYKWSKKLRNRAFSSDDKSEKKEKKVKKEKKEKKSFWETTWWNILKWLWIWSAAWWWIYGISKLLWWNKDKQPKPTNTPSNDTNTWNIDHSQVDTRWFTPWAYPFKHITTPYKWIKAYRVDNVKLDPLIWFNQLSLNWTEWNLTTLKVKDQELHFNNTSAAWYKKNNPCNVSPFKGDVWRSWSSRVADWQDHGKYNSMEDWLASFMRLMRKDRYRNKSIQWINCSGMQWIYSQNEPDSLKALRVIWITRACNNLNVSPFTRLNTDDKETMMAFTQQTAINESWSYFDRATLERAYKKAFW